MTDRRFVAGAQTGSGTRFNDELLFSMPGPIFTNPSGRYYPKTTITITGILMSLGSSYGYGATVVEVQVLVNGTLLSDLKIDPTVANSNPVVVTGLNKTLIQDTDYIAINIVQGDGSSSDLVVQVRLS